MRRKTVRIRRRLWRVRAWMRVFLSRLRVLRQLRVLGIRKWSERSF